MCLQNILNHLQKALKEVSASMELINNKQSSIKKLKDKKAKESAIKTIKNSNTEE